jgi:hypothetical protein
MASNPQNSEIASFMLRNLSKAAISAVTEFPEGLSFL